MGQSVFIFNLPSSMCCTSITPKQRSVIWAKSPSRLHTCSSHEDSVPWPLVSWLRQFCCNVVPSSMGVVDSATQLRYISAGDGHLLECVGWQHGSHLSHYWHVHFPTGVCPISSVAVSHVPELLPHLLSFIPTPLLSWKHNNVQPSLSLVSSPSNTNTHPIPFSSPRIGTRHYLKSGKNWWK
jgi:hypothetical protein